MPLLEITGLSAGYATKEVLHEIRLVIGMPQFAGIIGANGCGKTTCSGTSPVTISPGAVVSGSRARCREMTIRKSKDDRYTPGSSL